MSKLITCKSCGHSIAKSAKVCPNCGAKNKRTSKLTWLLAGVFVFAIVISMQGTEQPSDSGSQANTPAPKFTVDCSMDVDREQLVSQLISEGYWQKVQYTTGIARVSVMPLFTNLITFDDKEKFVSIAAAANFCRGGEASARIIDAMSNETIGSYSAEYGGLSLD